MTSDVKASPCRGTETVPARVASSVCFAILVAAIHGMAAVPAAAADASYPFEGTWVRANRACTPNAPLARTYTARDVTSPTSHCGVRKVATGSGQFEIFEDCRRAEHPGNFTETIRMQGPDAMVVRRQVARLKIARPLRYIRCSIAAPGTTKPPAPAAPRRPTASGEAPAHAPEDRAVLTPPETTAPKP